MGNRMRRTVISALVMGSALIVVSLSACRKQEAPPPAPRPVAVIAPVPLQDLAGEAYPGSVRARVETPLSFRVPGKITERRVDIGVHVSKGAVLAVLDPIDARLNVEASVAAVSAAEADAQLAESEFKRYQNLSESGFVSSSALDLRRNQMELAQARLKQARSQLAVIRNQAGYTSLTADADGTVTEVIADAGQVVSAGQPVLGFARDGEREVRITVAEGAAVEALRKAGQLAITLWAVPGKIYPGKLREIAASADARTRTHEARVSFVTSDEQVVLGMSASVIVGAASDRNAWRLPLSAVSEVDGKPVIWRVQAGATATAPVTAQPLSVQVLKYLDDSAVVAGNIAKDDRVISAGAQLLHPGMVVRPIDRTAPVAL